MAAKKPLIIPTSMAARMWNSIFPIQPAFFPLMCLPCQALTHLFQSRQYAILPKPLIKTSKETGIWRIRSLGIFPPTKPLSSAVIGFRQIDNSLIPPWIVSFPGWSFPVRFESDHRSKCYHCRLQHRQKPMYSVNGERTSKKQ